MEVRIHKKTHEYYIDKVVANASVTEMLAKQGIAPDLSNIPTETLEKARKYGNRVHKDIEKVFRVNEQPKTAQGKAFMEWFYKNCSYGTAEMLIGLKWKSILIGGTIDFVGIGKNGELIVGDHKTTSAFEREYVTWQVNIYDYMLRRARELNGKTITWAGATKFYCFWYGKNDKLQVYELAKIPDVEIEKMLDCQANGTKYQRPTLSIEPSLANEIESLENEIAEYERQMEITQKRQDLLKAKLKTAMEKQNIVQWETPSKRYLFTYVAETSVLRVDSKRLQSERPDIYAKYLIKSKRGSYLKITKRENVENE